MKNISTIALFIAGAFIALAVFVATRAKKQTDAMSAQMQAVRDAKAAKAALRKTETEPEPEPETPSNNGQA